MEENKSIIIIGAGIAGLSTGCYGQMNGYRTRIFELPDKPGGVCTAWKRKGYTFDGCIHWLGGSAPGNIVHTIWEELGAVQGRRMINHEVFKQIVIGDRNLRIHTNLDRFEQALKGISPRDGQVIEELVREVRRFSTFSPPWDKVIVLSMYAEYEAAAMAAGADAFVAKGDLAKKLRTIMSTG